MTQKFHSLVCIPKRNENISSEKQLYTNVYSSTIHQPKTGNNSNVHQLMNGRNKMFMLTMECDSAIKRNVILMQAI